MAAKPCDVWCHRWGTFYSPSIGSYTCKVFPQSVQSFQSRFVKVFFFQKKSCQTTWPMASSIFSVDQFIPWWPSKIFILIACRVLCIQMWCLSKGTDDIIKKKSHLFSIGSTDRCQVSIFHWAVSEIQRSISPFFPSWLLDHLTYDVIIIKMFHMRSCTNSENFLSIQQAVERKGNNKMQTRTYVCSSYVLHTHICDWLLNPAFRFASAG